MSADSDPLSGGSRDFGVASEARRVDRSAYNNRVFFGVIGAVFVALAIYILIPPYHQPPAAIYVVDAVIWAVSGTLLYASGMSRFKRALTDVKITSTDLTLSYEDGKRIVQGWTDPTFGLTLRDYTIDPLSPVEETDHIHLLAPNQRFGTVPPGVAFAIKREAEAHGLPVAVRKEAITGYKTIHVATTTRIGRIEETPDYKGHETPAR
jgi:hypothetical protein